MNNMFEKFLSLYQQDMIKIFFYKDSYSIAIANNDILENEEKEDFNEFCGNFISFLREKVVDKRENEDYKDYVQKFLDLEQNKYMESEIITKSSSNLNTIFSIDHEILTKRDINLKEDSFSVLININFKKPTYRNDELDQINFELSLKDLEMLNVKIEELFKNINSISNKEV